MFEELEDKLDRLIDVTHRRRERDELKNAIVAELVWDRIKGEVAPDVVTSEERVRELTREVIREEKSR